MLKKIIDAVKSSVSSLFGDWQKLVAFLGCYAALLLALYLFLTTPVGRVWQVVVMFMMAIAIPVLFFVLQTMGVTYLTAPAGFKAFCATSLREFWKVLVISIPLLLITWLIVWGLGKIDFTVSTGLREAAMSSNNSQKIEAAENKIRYLASTVSWIKFVYLYFVLPLISIQLWISTLEDGLTATLKGIGRVILRSFAPRSIITYLLGVLVFLVIPYYLISTRTPIKSPWLDLSVLGFRLTVAFVIALLGWVVTVGAIQIARRQDAG